MALILIRSSASPYTVISFILFSSPASPCMICRHSLSLQQSSQQSSHVCFPLFMHTSHPVLSNVMLSRHLLCMPSIVKVYVCSSLSLFTNHRVLSIDIVIAPSHCYGVYAFRGHCTRIIMCFPSSPYICFHCHRTPAMANMSLIVSVYMCFTWH